MGGLKITHKQTLHKKLIFQSHNHNLINKLISRKKLNLMSHKSMRNIDNCKSRRTYKSYINHNPF
jgi:hypothetical protein